jgi:hypothetical protein
MFTAVAVGVVVFVDQLAEVASGAYVVIVGLSGLGAAKRTLALKAWLPKAATPYAAPSVVAVFCAAVVP